MSVFDDRLRETDYFLAIAALAIPNSKLQRRETGHPGFFYFSLPSNRSTVRLPDTLVADSFSDSSSFSATFRAFLRSTPLVVRSLYEAIEHSILLILVTHDPILSPSLRRARPECKCKKKEPNKLLGSEVNHVIWTSVSSAFLRFPMQRGRKSQYEQCFPGRL